MLLQTWLNFLVQADVTLVFILQGLFIFFLTGKSRISTSSIDHFETSLCSSWSPCPQTQRWRTLSPRNSVHLTRKWHFSIWSDTKWTGSSFIGLFDQDNKYRRSANTGWDTQGDTTANLPTCLPWMSQIHRFGNGNGSWLGNCGKISTFCPKIKCVRQSFRTIPHQDVWHDHRIFWSEISWIHVKIFQDPSFEM